MGKKKINQWSAMGSNGPILKLGQNYLTWYFRLLTIFGMWNPYEEYDGKKNLYTCYAAGLFFFAGTTPSLGEIIHTWKNRKDIVAFTQHFTMVTAMGSTMAKIVNLWHRRTDLEIVTDLLNWERRQFCDRKFAVYRDKIILSTMRACRIFSSTFIVLVIWYCLFSYGKNLVYFRGDLDKLSISPLLFLHSNKTFPYWLLFVIDKTTVSYLAGCTACHDTFFMVFLIHVGAQLDLLKRRLESCQDKLNYSLDNDLITKDYNFSNIQIECVCRTRAQEITLDPIVELHTCVEHHQKILRYVELVQNIFNSTLLLQFGTSLLIITMVGFQIFGERRLSNNEFIDSMNFLICALFQLFLYCWFGTDIISKSESISFSAYNSKWYNADGRFKKTLSIVLCRGQIPIVFRAGYICELSSQTFMNVISKCYSSMALLNRVNE